MGFDSRKNIQRTADAESFTATITEGSNVCSAAISYKKGFKIGPPSITARNMDALLDALHKQDATVRFYKTASDAGTLSAKDAATLEALRVDAKTPDAVYRTACASFGQKPQPRPNTTTVASKTNAPQPVVSFISLASVWQEFESLHGELWSKPYGDINLKLIEQFLKDENMQGTKENLEQAYRELKAANCFRTAATLTRGMNGDLQIVQPYSHERIVAMRNRQVVAQQNAAPSNLSEVDRAAWQAVHAKYPQLPVTSAGFKKCCADTVRLWLRDFVLEQHPELAAAGKRGELNKAMDAVLLQWMRNPNLGQGQKTIKDTRIWLG